MSHTNQALAALRGAVGDWLLSPTAQAARALHAAVAAGVACVAALAQDYLRDALPADHAAALLDPPTAYSVCRQEALRLMEARGVQIAGAELLALHRRPARTSPLNALQAALAGAAGEMQLWRRGGAHNPMQWGEAGLVAYIWGEPPHLHLTPALASEILQGVPRPLVDDLRVADRAAAGWVVASLRRHVPRPAPYTEDRRAYIALADMIEEVT